MHKIDKESKLLLKESRKQLEEEVKKNALKLKEDTKRLRIERKEFAKKWKQDTSRIKTYNQEIKEFEKEGLKDVKKRVQEAKDWLNSVEKTKANKKRYKYMMTRAKNVNYDYSGDIIFEDVSYTYSRKTPYEFKALDGTNLTIKKGIITAIIGTTGSGKSTLIQLANGLLISDSGRSVIGNFQIPARTKKISQIKPLRREIGLVFQFPEYQLFQETIEKDISYGPINMGGLAEDEISKVPELLKLVDLPVDYAKRSPFALSGGQKRRVAIAGIIAMDGNTLVLDEPTGGLDPKGEEDFMSLFYRLNKEKDKRIIIVTHNMDHVLQIADEVIVMSEGKVIKKGTPFEIFKNDKLLHQIEIEPPKIYKLAHSLKAKGIDVTDKEFRTIEEFALAVKEAKKTK